ncbi:hypothetical protein POM88_021617 [Heracleum sosnowskyi]|uniref:BED-type domain-containing protein n=1 Tax=Heracleum sosnowskyi TaxID=360622 RepID=A0AAD8MSY8_9APIA|nr:hypothetical protein POM88_021617 [Heracleum sosnowskyi]
MRFKFLWMLQKLKYFQNSEVEVKPLRSLPYDLPGQTFVAFEKPEGVTAVGNFLKCLEIYCERAEDGGVEDEYQSEDLEVVAEDYILKGSEVVPNNARPRTCLLSGVYIENMKVLVILSFGIDISDDISVSDALHEIGASGSLVVLMNKVREENFVPCTKNWRVTVISSRREVASISRSGAAVSISAPCNSSSMASALTFEVLSDYDICICMSSVQVFTANNDSTANDPSQTQTQTGDPDSTANAPDSAGTTSATPIIVAPDKTDSKVSNSKAKATSDVWNYFEKRKVKNDIKAKCVFCGKEYLANSKNGTSTLWTHFNSCPKNTEKAKNKKQKTLAFQKGNENMDALLNVKFDPEIYDKDQAFRLAEKVRVTLVRLVECYGDKSSSSKNMGMSQNVDAMEIDERESPSHLSLLKSRLKNKLEEEESLDLKSELDKFLDEQREKDVEQFDILNWWKVNSSRFPILSSIAKDVLAIPVSTVASESAFSVGGRVLDSFRSSLTPPVVEALICGQDWLRSSPLDFVAEENMDDMEKLESDFAAMVM